MRILSALIITLVTLTVQGQSLPMDPAVRYGKLDNGLTYYISQNPKATEKAEFYIVQRVGSILEEEHQRGLAHFLEHMAFNGTKNFPGKTLISYLESNGVRFGVDINAYTAFDQTVYSISNVPTQRIGLVDSCLLILHDWSGYITLDAEEIDAERKVIHEEWRTKRNVRDRIYEQTLPKLFPDSNRYAYRMPIGLMEVVEHGFTAEEFARSQQQIEAWIPSLEAGVGISTSNQALVQRCMAHFLHHQPLLSQVEEAKVYRYMLDNVTLEEMNARFNDFLYTPNGMAILLQGQEREGNVWPTETEVLQAYGQAWYQKTMPHKIPELEPALELMPQKPQSGSIVKIKRNKTYGTQEFLLSNGAKVILKPTRNTRSEIRLTAISNGGTSLMPNTDYNNINAINALPPMGGLAHLSGNELGRALQGSSVSYQVNVGTLTESFTGTCDPSDAEQLLQLLHLRFTTMRQDTMAFQRWQQRMSQTLSQRIENPMTLFSDTLRETMYEAHPRNRRATMDLADGVDYDRTCRLFMERFANAADFTFIFVGQIDTESLKPLICQYIASLPGNSRQKEKANFAALPPLKHGKHVTHVNIPEGVESTTVIYNILAKKRYNQKNSLACSVLSEVMNTLCTETLREQEGGTYNVSVTSRISRQPADELTIMFNFNTNPEQADKLLQQAIALLAQVAKEGPSTVVFNSAHEYLKKRHSDYLGTNAYWMETLTEQARFHSDDMLTNGKALQNLTPKDIQRIARRLTRSPHTAEIILNGTK